MSLVKVSTTISTDEMIEAIELLQTIGLIKSSTGKFTVPKPKTDFKDYTLSKVTLSHISAFTSQAGYDNDDEIKAINDTINREHLNVQSAFDVMLFPLVRTMLDISPEDIEKNKEQAEKASKLTFILRQVVFANIETVAKLLGVQL